MEQLQQLNNRIDELEKKLNKLYRSSDIDRNVETALIERLGLSVLPTLDKTNIATLTGILKGAGSSTLSAIVPLAGTKVYYVSDSSGGAVTRKLTFTSGILTSET